MATRATGPGTSGTSGTSGASGTLLIDDGGLPALAAAAIETRPAALRIYHPRGWGPAAPHRRAVAAEHAVMLGGGEAIVDALAPLDLPEASARRREIDGLAETVVLVRAALAAVQLGCRRITWPVALGPEAGPVGRAVERASMVAALADLEAGLPAAEPVVIDAPLVDLTDAEIVDLADDAGAPMRSFRACDGAGAEPCGRCDGCRRWRTAFDEAGVPWPWAPAAV